jgi:hypothetical protein
VNTGRDHLDAETVAAWLDGGLDAVSLAAAEAHASNCERCQALLATVVKTDAQLAPGFSRGMAGIPRLKAGANWWKWWMAPLAATAAAVTLWMVVPQEQLQPAKATVASDAEVAAPAQSARARDEAPPGRRSPGEGGPVAQATEPASAAQSRFDEGKRQADASSDRDRKQVAQGKLGAAASAKVTDAVGARDQQANKAEERLARLEAEPARAPAAPAAPPAAGAPAEVAAARENAPITQLRKQAGPALEFVSPNPNYRWRATPEGIDRSEDGGRIWLPVRLRQGEVITGGASPAPMVCWMIGRGGLVLLATDGTNFTRLPFPERIDLTAVSSPELRIAVVTAADGRVFRTENAGRTWIRQ